MKTTALGLAIVGSLFLSGQALAGGLKNCTDVEKSAWKTQDEAMAVATAAGYETRKMKINGTCYEVYGIGKDGALFELFYNPVTLELMKTVKKG